VFHPGDDRIRLNEHVPIPDTPSSATSSPINDYYQFEPGMNLPSNLPTSNFFTDPYPADTMVKDEVNGNVQFSIPTTDSLDFSSLFATNPPDYGNVSYFGDSLPMMDNETLKMWSMAPTSLELDEWGSYISSVEQMTQSHGRFPLA